MKIKTDFLYNKYLYIYLFISFFYLSYRYIFQYNSAYTGLVYTDTPYILKLGKYLIYLGLFSLSIPIITLKGSLDQKVNGYKFMGILFIIFHSLISYTLFGVLDDLELCIFFICALALTLMPLRNQLKTDNVNKFFAKVLLAYLCFNIFQMIAFIWFDRLPGLAYPNSYSIRFGSIIDDPNGFGQLLALFIGFAYYYYHGWKCILIISTLFLFLLFTQSMTAIFSIPISIIIIYLFNQFRAIKILKILSFVMLISVVLIIVNSQTNIFGFIELMYTLKEGSMSAHIYGYQKVIDNYTLSTFFGINHVGVGGDSESDLLNLFNKGGILLITIYIFLFVNSIVECRKVINNKYINDKAKALHAGIALFLFSVLISSSNLPFSIIFPINSLVAIFIILSNPRLWDYNISI